MNFEDPNISIASEADLPALEHLLNIAYRGEASRKGWTTEADLIAGDTRTDMKSLQQVFHQPGSVFLIYRTPGNSILACVNLQKQDNKLYLGMFAVEPTLQGGGIGKKMLQAAEDYAHKVNTKAIFMSVVSVRDELIAWYKRHGYKDTGIVKDFPEDDITGKHLQELYFIILEKQV